MFPPLEEETVESREGEASHWVAATELNSYRNPDAEVLTCESLIGETAPNGVVITAEMAEAAHEYTMDVHKVSNTIGGLRKMFVEHKLYAPQIHPLNFGTCDCFIFDQERGELWVWDYKYGHDYVSEFDNWQLTNYIAGIVHLFKIDGIADQHIRVHVRIAQPRCYSAGGIIREANFLLSDFRGDFNYLSAKFHEALSPEAKTTSGPQCRHCSARHSCGTARKAASAAIDYSEHPEPQALDDEAIGIELAFLRRAADAIKYRLEGLEELADVRSRAGHSIYGHMREANKGRTHWSRPAPEVILLGKLMEVDLAKPPEAITPTQATKKLSKAGKDPSVIKAFSTYDTGSKLVAINSDKLKRRFKT